MTISNHYPTWFSSENFGLAGDGRTREASRLTTHALLEPSVLEPLGFPSCSDGDDRWKSTE
jgi:hypothetical protein